MNENAASSKTSRPFGFWATIGFSALAYALPNFVVFLITVPISFLALFLHWCSYENILQIANGGIVFCISTILAGALTLSCLFTIIHWGKTGNVRDYFHLHPLPFISYLKWSVLFVVFLIASYHYEKYYHIPISTWMIHIYETTPSKLLLCFTIIVIAPVAEEFFYRGFLFKGIQFSRLGGIGAVLITAIVWTLIHTQYNIHTLVEIFALGLLLGCARLYTHSLYLPILFHVLNNAFSIIGMAYHQSNGTSTFP